ncbi:MAG TPA: histidine kinase [Patescibacteria group bacterium]|nr:histidine kinase [Patescibacteria group bacterium]
MTRVSLTGDQLVVFILFFKMGIMAAVAVVLVTSSFFKRLLLRDRRTERESWQFSLIFGILLLAGTAVRVLAGYEGLDLSLSGTFLVGLLAGMAQGSSIGALVSLPAVLRGEWAALPFTVLCGLAGGIIRRVTARREEFWDFSPLPPNNVLRSFKTFRAERRIDARALIIVSILILELVRTGVARWTTPSALFALRMDHSWMVLVVWLSTLACVGIPLKIWHNTRVEEMLEEQRMATVRARFEALRSQINPHFLFNTLNAATSCIWTEPDKARWILVKLSQILRRLLHGTEDFVPLSKELEFIDDYLSLEEARFGKDKIRFEKEVDPRAFDVPVPAMILQPLVENAVKHGISRKREGGTIRIDAVREGDWLRVSISDDGMGFNGAERTGIGLSNVRERLQVAYGVQGSLEIASASGGGACVSVRIPVERGSEHAKRP